MTEPTVNSFSAQDSINILDAIASNKKIDPSKLEKVTQSIVDLVTTPHPTIEKRDWAATQLYLLSHTAQSTLDQLQSKNSSKLKQHKENLQIISNAYESIINQTTPNTSVSHIPNPENWTASQADNYKAAFTMVHINQEFQMTELPATLIVESHVDSVISKKCDKKLIQECSLNNKSHERATPTQGLTGVWLASRPEKQKFKFSARQDQVTPNLQSSISPSNDLANVHYQVKGNQITVTSGAVDSVDKAKELLSTIKEARNGAPPQTILMLELDSAYLDSETIHNQHQAAQFLNRQIHNPDKTSGVAHINLCLAGYSQMPGRMEDNYSYEQNIPGLVTMTSWMPSTHNVVIDLRGQIRAASDRAYEIQTEIAEIKKNPSTTESANELKKLTSEFNNLVAFINNTSPLEVWLTSGLTNLKETYTKLTLAQARVNDLKKQSIDIQTNLKSASPSDTEKLKAKLKEITPEISFFEKEISDLNTQTLKLLSHTAKMLQDQATYLEKDPKKALSLLILSTLINQHTGSSNKLSRTAEVELTLLFAKLQGDTTTLAISSSNGIDETGFAKALLEAQDALITQLINDGKNEEEAYKTAFEIISNMDTLSTSLDKLTFPLLANEKVVISNLSQYENATPSDLPLLIKAQIDSHANLRYAWFYQQHVASSLFRTAMPAAIEGTGLPGLSFGFDTDSLSPYASNSLLLSRLPSFLISEDKKVIQLYTKGGVLHSRWPTDAGSALIFRDSKLRLNNNK
ncbi:MAG: hypothetical protein WC222_07215 [Parachlamydiales bacterium]|jgi:hypothetical protein